MSNEGMTTAGSEGDPFDLGYFPGPRFETTLNAGSGIYRLTTSADVFHFGFTVEGDGSSLVPVRFILSGDSELRYRTGVSAYEGSTGIWFSQITTDDSHAAEQSGIPWFNHGGYYSLRGATGGNLFPGEYTFSGSFAPAISGVTTKFHDLTIEARGLTPCIDPETIISVNELIGYLEAASAAKDIAPALEEHIEKLQAAAEALSRAEADRDSLTQQRQEAAKLAAANVLVATGGVVVVGFAAANLKTLAVVGTASLLAYSAGSQIYSLATMSGKPNLADVAAHLNSGVVKFADALSLTLETGSKIAAKVAVAASAVNTAYDLYKYRELTQALREVEQEYRVLKAALEELALTGEDAAAKARAIRDAAIGQTPCEESRDTSVVLAKSDVLLALEEQFSKLKDAVAAGYERIEPTLIIAGATDGMVRGTDAHDIIVAGEAQILETYVGLGPDIFVFGHRSDDGLRHTAVIRDYQPGTDFIDVGGAEIADATPFAGNLRLTLNGADRDLLVIVGVTDVDDLTFVDDWAGRAETLFS